MYWGSPRPPPGTMIPRMTHRTQHIVTLMAMIYYSKIYKAKRKGAWTKIGENQKPASKSPIPAESLRMQLIPPAIRWNNTCKVLCNREAH